jgi:prepilin-type processing-associated H-X9-DG protein
MKTWQRERNRKSGAFAMVDLIIVVSTLILGAIYLYYFATSPRAKGSGHGRIKCVSNLKQVGLAFRIWANEHDDKYPFNFRATFEPHTGTSLFQNTTNAEAWMHFQVLSNELSNAKILTCPEDRPRRNNTCAEDFLNGAASLSAASKRNQAVSYFVGLEADEASPNAILAGDRNLAPYASHPGYSSQGVGAVKVRLQSNWSEAKPGQIHEHGGNVAMADGSVQQLSGERLRDLLKRAEATYGTNANLFLFPQ